MLETFQVEIDYCTLVKENAATTLADRFAPFNGYSYVFLCGGAMPIEHRNDFFRRDTATLFHQLNDPLGSMQKSKLKNFEGGKLDSVKASAGFLPNGATGEPVRLAPALNV